MTGVFWRDIRRAILGASCNQLFALHLRGYHALWRDVPVHFNSQQRPVTGPTPHISPTSRPGIRFVLFCLRSTLLTESLLLSLPAGTEMLQFPAFPFLTEQLGNPRFKACMRLAVAYRSLPRPSTAPKPSHPLSGLRNPQTD